MTHFKSGEVALIIGVSKRTLQKWMKLGKIPAPQKDINGYYLWSGSDVQIAREYAARLKSTTQYVFRS